MKKKKAIEIIREIGRLNLETGSSGNVSFRADNNHIFIKPTGLTYVEVNENNLSVVDINNPKLISGGNPSSDLLCHLEIYRYRKDIKCILHSHSHFATVCAMLQMNIPVHSTMHADYFGSSIPCLPFINHRKDNFGTQIIEAHFDTVLLSNHGSLLLVKNPSEAKKRLEALEEIAKLYYHAITLATLKNVEFIQIGELDMEEIHRYFVDNLGHKN